MRLRNIPGSREVIAESPFCVQEPEIWKGRWKDYFGNDHPIHVEIGMGKGRFLMDMASLHPDINYIGIEMYSSVLIRAIQKAESQKENQERENPGNFCFLRMDARDLPQVFAEGELQKIYLNFSDPWPKDRHAKRRLTSGEFLERYERILPVGGLLEFKTDNRPLFDFSLEEVRKRGWELEICTYDLHGDPRWNAGNVMTEYEERFSSRGNPICKLSARCPGQRQAEGKTVHWKKTREKEEEAMVILVKEENFAREVVEAAGSVVVDMYADWCNPCKAMAPVVEALSQSMTDVKFCKCNVDQAPDLARQYRVFSIPVFLVFKNGELKASLVGVMDEEELEEEIRSALG